MIWKFGKHLINKNMPYQTVIRNTEILTTLLHFSLPLLQKCLGFSLHVSQNPKNGESKLSTLHSKYTFLDMGKLVTQTPKNHWGSSGANRDAWIDTSFLWWQLLFLIVPNPFHRFHIPLSHVYTCLINSETISQKKENG